MTEMQAAIILCFLMPTMMVGLPWAIGNTRVNRKKPRTIPISTPVYPAAVRR